MSLRLPLSRTGSLKTDKVKSLDFHSGNPWVLLALYNGTMAIYNHNDLNCVRTFEAGQLPVRCARFIEHLEAAVSGSDDLRVRVFNYNSGQKIREFEAHKDFIRSLTVHPAEGLLITCGDDGSINLWNYRKDFALVKTFS
jgi:coatomer subunit beta'